MDPIEDKKGIKINLVSPVSEQVVIRNCEDCTIEGVTFSYEGQGDQLELGDCIGCKVLGCTFRGKSTKGNFIHIKGEDSSRNLIEGCTFRDHTHDLKENGGEAIIVGDNELSGCLFETTIRKCEFINCKGDDELVSVKSCRNVLENNKIHDDCHGNICIRHGGFNIIQNNLFDGSNGGIRVYGDGNEIKNNYHKNNKKSEENRRPLLIENGNVDDDENVPNGKPIGKKGDNENYEGYACAKNNQIEGNIYENCKEICVLGGRKNQSSKPKNNTFRNNILIADSEDSEFVKFINGAEIDENTFEDNKMYGGKAKPGDLPESAVEHLEKPPQINVPDAGP
jgi:hypothetical protein